MTKPELEPSEVSTPAVEAAMVPVDVAPMLSPEILQHVLLGGDLSKLTAPQRLSLYRSTCASLHLNPLTKPFDYLRLSGREVLYATKNCAEQLRNIRHVSLGTPRGELLDGGLYQVWVEARLPDGRTDADMGAVDLSNLKGEARANAMMKAITKAKRRATLSICGLGMLDESEISSIPDARPLHFDPETGEVDDEKVPTGTISGPEPKISERQQKRLFVLAKQHGWSVPQLRRHLLSKYAVHNSKQLLDRVFDRVCADLARGPRASGEVEQDAVR